jgi:hypothetical protein
MEALADPSSLAGLDEGDPHSVVRWMKRMGRETGEDLGGGFDEEIDHAVDDTADESSLADHGDLEP